MPALAGANLDLPRARGAHHSTSQQAEVLGAIKRQQLKAASKPEEPEVVAHKEEEEEEPLSCQCYYCIPQTTGRLAEPSMIKTNRKQLMMAERAARNGRSNHCDVVANQRSHQLAAASQPRPLPATGHQDCAKCQLIARWTLAQAQLAKQATQVAQRARASDLQLAPDVSGHHRKASTGSSQYFKHHTNSQQQQQQKSSSDYCLATAMKARHHTSDRCHTPTDEAAEISSLTDTSSSLADDKEEPKGRRGHCSRLQHLQQADKWSVVSSCCLDEPAGSEATTLTNSPKSPRAPQVYPKNFINTTRVPSLRRGPRRLGSSKLVPTLGLRKRRPAPLPPATTRPSRRSTTSAATVAVSSSASSDKSVDSGHTSGPDSVASGGGGRGVRSSPSGASDDNTRPPEPNLLTESEVYSIEHFLRSHKSSIYVCGCMANLYLTNTNLVDNGRCSKPSSDGWRLSKTGVPVLTFDSGLTRNRSKRRLSINLTERGSGFVLWSDIIDHLSNYRAYSVQIHGGGGGSDHSLDQQAESNTKRNDKKKSNQEESCDTFHVMYLSTNHRIMVGLSFDDAKCARLFLKQVEMVTSDPQNIALTGPKLAHRLVSASRLGRLLARSHHQQNSLSSLKEKLPVEQAAAANRKLLQESRESNLDQSTTTAKNDNRKLEAARRSRLSRLISLSAGIPRRGDDAIPPSGGGWSTLKRAIRFGGHHQFPSSASQVGGRQNQQKQQDESTQATFVAPKPLASLAMAGKLYRPGKKMPRKCDISAPCLFQHVTRVDLSNLDKLYTRSLVGHQPPPEVMEPTDGRKSSPTEPQPAKLSMISQQQQQQPTQKLNGSTSTSLSSSTSCYSSASISPASSEYESRMQQQQQQQSRAIERTRRQHQQLPRPLPPRVPQRNPQTCHQTVAAQLKPVSELQQQRHQYRAGSEQPMKGKLPRQNTREMVTNGESKIQAIIRDLQTQTSAELVEAKRKLMADIADQVMARSGSNAAVSHL